MPNLVVVTHPDVSINPDVPVTDWGLDEVGRRRAVAFATSGTLAPVTHIWASAERKAHETARILAAPRSIPIAIEPHLGENDRGSTGFLPRDAFEAAADAFFASPHTSFRGWETALAAQERIRNAVAKIIDRHAGGDLAIVTHGAVGTLLWCAFSGHPIDRRHDQPGQGHYWRADLSTLKPEAGWRSIG